MSALTPGREAAIRRLHHPGPPNSGWQDDCVLCEKTWPCTPILLLDEVDRLREIERAAVAALNWWRSWKATPEYKRRPLDPGLAGLIAAMDLLAEAERRPTEGRAD